MAKKSSLSNDHHLVRHIREAEIDTLDDGSLVAFPQAFELRPNEKYLSNGWLEYFAGTQNDCLCGVVAVMSKSRQVKAHHGLATGNVGDIKEACSSFGLKVRIMHEPLPDNDAYATVRQITTEDQQLLDLLAAEAWNDVRLARPYVEQIGPWRKR